MNLTVQIDRIDALNLKAGDVVVVTVPAMTEPDQIAQVKEAFAGMFPGHQVLVKPSSIAFSIFNSDGDLVA